MTRKFFVLTVLTAATATAPAGAAATPAGVEARTIRYGLRDVVSLRCKVRYTTLIVLPQGEKILDFIIGDKDMWVLEGADRYAYLKPAGKDISTTVTLVTQAGNLYSFLASEVSGQAEPDVKVFVELSDPSQFQPPSAPVRYVPAEEAEQLRQQLVEEQAGRTKAIAAFASDYPTHISFAYQFRSNHKPFFVTAIWHDQTSTFIRSHAREKPTLYELKDGELVLINYDLKGDVYVVPKVLDAGRLTVGKQSLDFRAVGE
jgi:type IV secretory pathway VirB9-like protein